MLFQLYGHELVLQSQKLKTWHCAVKKFENWLFEQKVAAHKAIATHDTAAFSGMGAMVVSLFVFTGKAILETWKFMI